MNKDQLRDFITRTLKSINLYTEDAVNLLMGTAAQESHLGQFIKQIKGPALGIFQMEPATFDDIIDNYLLYKAELRQSIKKDCNLLIFNSKDLEWNLKLAICLARIHYLRCKEAIPNTIEGYAALWKLRYNTPLGKGTESEFIANYKKYVL